MRRISRGSASRTPRFLRDARDMPFFLIPALMKMSRSTCGAFDVAATSAHDFPDVEDIGRTPDGSPTFCGYNTAFVVVNDLEHFGCLLLIQLAAGVGRRL
mmetsp:Transcript_4887/g.12607  ORF Transcript_4887/g.12607 Transcript_4887/m.12607 type:complete len:100 (-) Transcript_4887:71-370(-)